MSTPTNSISLGLLAGSRTNISGGHFINHTIQACECQNHVIQNGACQQTGGDCDSIGGLILFFLRQGWERLFECVDTNAFHDSVTREAIFKDLSVHNKGILQRATDWVKTSNVAEHTLWAHGPSCTSSIAHAIASLPEPVHAALATFFVRKDPANEDVRARFIPTIAYQLGLSFPRVREQIGNIVAHDPAILSRSVSQQLDSLILQPLAPFLSVPDGVADGQYHPAVIIVDGCDYLDSYTQRCVVDALLKLAQQFPLRVRILLFTKSLAKISTSLTSGVEDGSVTEIVIDDERSLWAILQRVCGKIRYAAWKNGRT